MRKLFFMKVLTGIVWLLLSLTTRAQDPPVLKVLDGSIGEIDIDSSITVQDDKRFDPVYRAKMPNQYPVQNLVSLEINEGARVYLKGDFDINVTVRITRTEWDTTTTSSFDTTLKVKYRAASTYEYRNTYDFSSAFRVTARIMAITTSFPSGSPAWDVRSAVKLVNQLQAFPQYDFARTDTTSQLSDSSWTVGVHDELPVWWSPVIGASEYDLEWAYVDSASLATGRYGDSNDPNMALLFGNNASRVTITGTAYRIPLLYDQKGHLFYRVRAVQLKGTGRNEANWSSLHTVAHGRFNFDGHESRLNWQATTSFAEDGKRKSVVQYYDGSLRGRQTVTKDNSVNRTIVAESFYDYQGRPVIQVLPAPTLNTLIGYTPHFNRGLDQQEYEKNQFDSLAMPGLYCSLQAAPMDTLSGAAQYYSPNSPFRDSGVHKYVPDAEMFPFTETEYTQDNTGRINRQGGVGRDFRLGSGHETRYTYNTPGQRELDALFGTEVGDASHYFKNMVRDANGQYSISYVDMHGRTIATALAGTPPDSIRLAQLPSNYTATRTEALSDPASAIIKDLVMESRKSLTLTKPETLYFSYLLNPQAFKEEGCEVDSVCYDCLYDLQITITDDCNNQKLGGAPFDTLISNFTLDGIDTTCDNGTGFSVTFSKSLPEGSYEITKKLSVSRYAMDYYRDSVYLSDNCKKLEDFVAEQRALRQQVVDCKPTCAGCRVSVGDWPTFWEQYRTRNGIANEDTAAYRTMAEGAYDQAVRDCDALCDSAGEEVSVRQSMLLDMTPASGQYANLSNENDRYSIFYTRIDSSDDNRIRDTLPMYTLVRDYRDADGNLDKVFDERAGVLVYPWQLTPEVFAQRFKPTWAEALLEKHPEYCKLGRYEKLAASHLWDKQFEATDSYATALAAGYLNPTNEGSPVSGHFGGGPAKMDPLASYSTSFKNALRDSVLHYRQNVKVTDHTGKQTIKTVSLWSMATLTVMCPDAPKFGAAPCYLTYIDTANALSPATMCEGELDMAWRAYRQMYLDIKRTLINKWLKEDTCSGSMTAAQIVASGHQPHFSDVNEQLTLQPPADLPDNATEGKAMLDQYYASNCAAYAELWMQQLGGCTLYSPTALRDTIIPALTQICMEGADTSHPYGASSVKPSSVLSPRSFEAWLEQYNAARGGTTDTLHCNAYVITAPKPYDQQEVHGDKPLYTKPDSCECSTISSLYTKFVPKATRYGTFSNYLKQVYQTDVSDSVLNLMLSLCGYAGFPAADCDLVSQPLYLPPLFQCYTGDVCVDCARFKTLDNEFKQKYPTIRPNVADSVLNDTAQLAKNRLYEQFMNYRLGYSKTVDEYVAFATGCTSSSYDTLQGILDGFRQSQATTIHWVFQAGVNVDNPHLLMDSGYLQTPDTLGLTSGIPVAYFSRAVCLPQGYEIEMRIKDPGTALLPLAVYSGDSTGGGFYSHFASGHTLPDRIFMSVIKDSKGRDLLAQNDPAPGEGVEGSIQDWHIIKCKVTPTAYHFYVDGELIRTAVKAPDLYGQLIGYIVGFYVSVNGPFKVDWVRIGDHNGVDQYREDFSDPDHLAAFNGGASCPSGTCTDDFTAYFNQQKGTSYTFQQINNLYSSQGINLDVCGSSQSACDTLQTIVKDFRNLRQSAYGVGTGINTPEVPNEYFGDPYQIMRDGILQFPDSVQQRSSTPSYHSFIMAPQPNINFCWTDGYATEIRFKLGADMPAGNADVFYFGNSNFTATFSRRITGLYLVGVGVIEGSGSAYYGINFGGTGFDSILVSSNRDVMLDWVTLKLQSTPAGSSIYVNGTLVTFIPRATANPIHETDIVGGLAMLSRRGAVDWIKLYDANGAIRYQEDYNDPGNLALPDPSYICSTPAPDCQAAFTEYFNQQQGTNYTFRQIDSLYYKTCGHYLNVCEDDAPDCDKLNNLLTEYQDAYVHPASRIIDLPMRTFAGNRTPAEGPKGVFDVNGNLLGRTIDGTIDQINASFAGIWNNSPVNQQIGTITALPNGLFRLSLKPGQEMPCNGITGMRYYQFEEHTKDTLWYLYTGLGSFIDFGDGTSIKANYPFLDEKTRIGRVDDGNDYLTYKFNMGEVDYLRSRVHVRHVYPHTPQRSTYTVTVFHTDTLGTVGFTDYTPMGDSSQFTNLRGYFPQDTWEILFRGTRDTTINRTREIKNFTQINSIRWVEIINNVRPDNPGIFMQNNLGSFANNHDLRRLRIDGGFSLIPNYQSPGVVDSVVGQHFYENFPDFDKNFPNVRLIIIHAWTKREDDLTHFNFQLPYLRQLLIAYTDLPSGLNDSIYNQIARVTTKDSGVVSLSYGASTLPPTSLSSAARTSLINDKWLLSDYPYTDMGDYSHADDLFVYDTIPFTDQFTDFINQRLGTNLSYKEVHQLYQNCNNSLDDCNTPVNTANLTLCGHAQPVFPGIVLDAIDNCSDSTFFIQSKAQDLYIRYNDLLRNNFDSLYRAQCLQAYKYERFTVQRAVSEYHHTLYYYDQAGNLIKTIPPAGVRPNYDSLWLDDVAAARLAHEVKVPAHVLPAQYRYNTLNQVTAQQSPDGGKTELWYDRLGRLALSRNARQLYMSSAGSRYFSYTRYDVLGRITEVGQVRDTSATAVTDTFTRNEPQLTDWYTHLLNYREQVTSTVYDTAYDFGPLMQSTVVSQQHLRNRVSYVGYADEPGIMNTFNARTYYSYDIHGNVDTLLQDYGYEGTVPNIMNKNGNRFKKFVYEYDLISGKVNKVTYQPGFTDQWIHRYYYDAENRLTEVETSTDGYSWEREAKYEYYQHGPLARTLLGQQQVQGIDYAYTLQGWLKGVNSTGGTETHDIGGDGRTGSIHQFVARDAVGFNLNYFGGDYKAVNPGVNPFPAYRVPGTALPDSAYRPLYNGNISSMGVYISKLEAAGSGSGILYAYKYDQLNRLLQQDAYAGFDRNNNSYGSLNTFTNTFREEISYDANGNIQTYNRNGLLGKAMDRMTYDYYPGTNQLKRVNDAVPATEYGTSSNETIIDIDQQFDNNYGYDAIGNLIKDSSEGNTRIQWNVYGKITEITREPSVTANYSKLTFSYDAQGNRIGKVTTKDDGRMDYTWYVRDAQGNLMTTYTAWDNGGVHKDALQDIPVDLTERYIYGSSRVGVYGQVDGVNTGPLEQSFFHNHFYMRGQRQYELSNHLGNVLSTISDKKFGVSSDGSLTDYYQPDIQAGYDYYAFGMPSRVALAPVTQYRFGFNGKESDKEAKGWFNQQDYGMRIYDPRLGRFLSVDPLTGDYPSWSPYPFAMNRPIDGVDLDGMEWQPVNNEGQGVPADSKNVSKYIWKGFNSDGTPVKGTVSNGLVTSRKGFTIWYSSNSATKSGTATFFSEGQKEWRQKDVVFQNGTMPYNVDVEYKETWKQEGLLNKKITDVTTTIWNSNGSQEVSSETFNKGMAVNPIAFNSAGKFFNSVRYNLGFRDSPASEAIVSDGLGPVDYLIGWGEIKWGKGIRTLFNGGLSFAEYKIARGGGGLVGEIELFAEHPFYGKKFPNMIEYDHKYITRAMQRKYELPNWLVNNRINVIKTTTLKHAQRDLFRYRFLPREIKLRLGPGGDLR